MDILVAAYILLVTFFIAIDLNISITRNAFDVSKRSQNISRRAVIEKDWKTENNSVLSEHFLSFHLLQSILLVTFHFISLFLCLFPPFSPRYRRDKIVLFPREAYIIMRAIVSRGKPEREKAIRRWKKMSFWIHLTQNERGMTVQPWSLSETILANDIVTSKDSREID